MVLTYLDSCIYEVSSPWKEFSLLGWTERDGTSPFGCHGNHLPPMWKLKYFRQQCLTILITLAKNIFRSLKNEVRNRKFIPLEARLASAIFALLTFLYTLAPHSSFYPNIPFYFLNWSYLVFWAVYPYRVYSSHRVFQTKTVTGFPSPVFLPAKFIDKWENTT